MKIGQWVAIYLENDDDPSIGKVASVNEEEIEVVWYKGKWATQWTEWKVHVKGKSWRTTAWTSWVKKESIVLFDFQLTATNRLKKDTMIYLQCKYAELRKSS